METFVLALNRTIGFMIFLMYENVQDKIANRLLLVYFGFNV